MTVQIFYHPSLSSLELSFCVPALFSHSVIHSTQFPLFWRGLKETTDTETEEFEISCICGPVLTVSNSRLWRLQLLTHWPVLKIQMSSIPWHVYIFKIKYYIIYVIYNNRALPFWSWHALMQGTWCLVCFLVCLDSFSVLLKKVELEWDCKCENYVR